MAFTNFTIEGDAILGYFSDQPAGADRHVRIKDDDASDTSDEANPGEVSIGDRVEQIIANSLKFPNDGEFDDFFQRVNELREKGLQPADGVADITREGVRLRITVEVVENE